MHPYIIRLADYCTNRYRFFQNDTIILPEEEYKTLRSDFSCLSFVSGGVSARFHCLDDRFDLD